MTRNFTVIVLMVLSCFNIYGSIISFEDLPDANFFNDAGVNIGSFYTGVTFGPDVTGLSVTRFGGYNDAGFPPHSGDVVVWSAFDFDTTITFAVPLVSVGIWYTSFDFLTLTAYDAANAVLGSVVGNPNTDGSFGVSQFLGISAPGISSVVISGIPGFFVFDDLTYEPVPEPASVVLVGSGLALLFLRRRRRRRGVRDSPGVPRC